MSRQRKPLQRKKPLARASADRYATCCRRGSTILAARKPVKKVNAKRRQSEFARCYGGTKGMGRKSGYRCIAPLSREAHRLWDTNPARFTERFGEFDGQAMADWTQRQWEAHCEREGQRVREGQP